MTGPQWLEQEFQRGARERWCMVRGCTTCGSYQMFELLTGQPWPERGSVSSVLRQVSWERAHLIVDGLKHCSDKTDRHAIMWMLQMLWERFGERSHANLFPSIEGSYAGDVLASMRVHYAKKQERRRLHDLRQGLKKKDWPE